MLKRIVRSAIVFAVIWVAYQAYVLLAMPWMEPPVALRSATLRPTQREPGRAATTLTKYQLLLSNYFPEGHWTQLQPPKVIASANEQAMLVLDDYQRLAPPGNAKAAAGASAAPLATQVKIERFALLVFPTPPREGVTPPTDAIILEAPQGATLQFDDFRPERGHIGQITQGEFPGRITIRSSMHDPGPEDDLLVETADLAMNTRLLYTNRPVRFRMGQNVGSGEELEIRLLVDDHMQPRDAGFKMAGIDSLEIRRNVHLRLQLETESLLPGDNKKHAPHAPTGIEAPSPPVDVSCSGPFRFDCVRYIASVDRDVVLRLLNPTGPSDQLTCNQLDLHFTPRSQGNDHPESATIDPERRKQRELGRLEPAVIVAEGHPVVVTSPARGAEARGDRIQIGLRDRRVAISGDRDCLLTYGSTVIRAPAIEYQHPANESATAIGNFKAAGPGTLKYVRDAPRLRGDKPEQVLQATWQRLAELGRDNGQPILALEGRPQLAMTGMGALTADRIIVYLRELQGSSMVGPLPLIGGSAGTGKLRILPDRLAARGRVEIQSAQLTGRTQELLASFRTGSSRGPATPTATAPATVGGKSNQGGGIGSTGQPGLLPIPSFAGRSEAATQPQQSYQMEADRIQVGVLLHDETATPASVACDGNVVFRELPAPPIQSGGTAEQALEVRGGHMVIDQLESGTAHISLTGVRPAPDPTPDLVRGGAGSQLAQLIGRGVTVLAETVEVDQHNNRLWSNGPGKAMLLVAPRPDLRSGPGGRLNGAASTTPIPVEISWQGGLEFDGRTVVFRRGVSIVGMDDEVHCDELSARLSAMIQFGQPVPLSSRGQQAIGLAEVECRGRVTIDHRSRDETGIVSHERAELPRLAINQQTGEISGDGPGVLRSTRLGEGLTSLGSATNLPGKPSASALSSTAGSRLNFLRIDFQQGIDGNIYTREITFRERIRTTYGPVDSWQQELDADHPEALPPESIRLSCDELRVNEDPIAARAAARPPNAEHRPIGPIQLQALGNVRIDGQSEERGAFGAQALRATYEQAKDAFVLEGDLRTPASLSYAGQQGPPPQARRIRYVPSTGELKIEGLLFLEITPGDVKNTRLPGPVRK